MRPDVLARAFGTDLPLSRTSRTASALNSLVNARRFRFAMTHSYRTFVRSGVSTKPGQVQYLVVVARAATELIPYAALVWFQPSSLIRPGES